MQRLDYCKKRSIMVRETNHCELGVLNETVFNLLFFYYWLQSIYFFYRQGK